MPASDFDVTEPFVRRIATVIRISDEEKSAIRKLPIRRTEIKADQDVVRQGESPTRMFFIVEGMTATYKIVSDSRRQIVGFHLPGDAPDLQSVHLRSLDVSIATITPSTIGFVTHTAILEVCDRFPRLTSAFWRHTLVDAAIFREWMANIGQRSALSRIAHLLCELVVRFRAVGAAGADTIHFPITQAEIGDAMGLSSVHVNRSLMQLRAKGYFILQDSTLQLLDWEGLQIAGDFSPEYLHLRELDIRR
jgi:CRP-like cAMP-binding protein